MSRTAVTANRYKSVGARRGFTLIELLVVIAIISILASMLFPAFSRAREQAKKIVCVSDMKQIGISMMMYTQDYDERYPIGYPWWDVDVNGLTKQPSLMNVMNPYTKSSQIWVCPSWTGRYTANTNYDGNFSFLTGRDCSGNDLANSVIGVPGVLDPASLAGMDKSAEYPLLFCGEAPQQDGTCTGLMNAHSGILDSNWKNGVVGGDSLLFADGHARYLPMGFGRWKRSTEPRGPAN